MNGKAIALLLAAAVPVTGLASGAVGGAAYAKAPGQIALAADSPDALVVMQSEWWQPAPSMQSAYKLLLSTYTDEDAKLQSNAFSGNTLIEAKKNAFVDGYLIARIKPGRWVFQSYSQQDKWALCFNAASLQFEVKPGEVVYLGRFDAPAHRRQLTEAAIASGRTRISGYGFADFFDQPQGPQFAAIDEGQLAALREMLFRRAPDVTAPVRAATYAPAQFGTGSTLFAERKCGGYFRKGAKDKDTKDVGAQGAGSER